MLVTRLETKEYYENFGMFREGLQKQGKYMSTVMRMIETLFLFIRSTRQELWELQLVSLDRYTKYFFSLDLTNYARMAPIYLSQMYHLRDADPYT